MAQANRSSRIVAVIRACVAVTPASWTQWATELSEPYHVSEDKWTALAGAAGLLDGRAPADVRRDVLVAVWAEAAREFEAARVAVQAADARLRATVAGV